MTGNICFLYYTYFAYLYYILKEHEFHVVAYVSNPSTPDLKMGS